MSKATMSRFLPSMLDFMLTRGIDRRDIRTGAADMASFPITLMSFRITSLISPFRSQMLGVQKGTAELGNQFRNCQMAVSGRDAELNRCQCVQNRRSMLGQIDTRVNDLTSDSYISISIFNMH
jgi:hypothetical protein